MTQIIYNGVRLGDLSTEQMRSLRDMLNGQLHSIETEAVEVLEPLANKLAQSIADKLEARLHSRLRKALGLVDLDDFIDSLDE